MNNPQQRTFRRSTIAAMVLGVLLLMTGCSKYKPAGPPDTDPPDNSSATDSSTEEASQQP